MVQLQFINKLITSKDKSLLVDTNLDETFFNEFPDEFKFIKDHFDKYNTIPDMVTFCSNFSNFDVIEVDESNQYLIDKLYEEKNARDLATVFNKIRSLINDGKINEALQVYSTSSGFNSKSNYTESVDILRNTQRYDDYIDRVNDFSKYYITTGFKELDAIVGGWDRREEYATIIARSNMGKSWLLLKCALAAAEQGLRVGIYSGEMSEKKVGYRLDTLISHISNSDIIRGNSYIQNQYKKYIDNLPNRFSGSIRVLTPAMIDGPAGVNALRSFIEKDNLDILCIDQHSLLDDDRKAKNPVERASNISKDIKNLQVLKKIPIITVSQQNRESTENGTDLTHIAQSDRIGQDSTIVLAMEQKDGKMTIKIIKSRDSVAGKELIYAIDLNKGVFTYIPSEGEVSEEDQQRLKDEYGEEDGYSGSYSF